GVAICVAITGGGTWAPAAAGGPVPYTPQLSLAALMAMRARYGDHVFRRYGFIDAFNPTLDSLMKIQAGAIVPGVGWFDDDYLGIDQGPILAMLENWRTGLVWTYMRKNQHIPPGLPPARFPPCS